MIDKPLSITAKSGGLGKIKQVFFGISGKYLKSSTFTTEVVLKGHT